MQFRQQKNKIQVLAYKKYNREKKRAEVELLGSFDVITFELSAGLLNKLTVEQLKELEAEITKRKQSDLNTSRLDEVKNIYSHLIKLHDCLKDNNMTLDASKLSETDAVAIKKVLKELNKSIPIFSTKTAKIVSNDEQPDLCSDSKQIVFK